MVAWYFQNVSDFSKSTGWLIINGLILPETPAITVLAESTISSNNDNDKIIISWVDYAL